MLGIVTASQVAHQLLLSGKTKKNKAMSQRLKRRENDKKSEPESEQGILKENVLVPELQKTIGELKNRKEAGLDHI